MAVPIFLKTTSRSWDQYDTGLFTPPENLSVLSETQFTVLGHPKSSFCDETVQAYTGYIDIEARHIFFYFFESRNDPDTDACYLLDEWRYISISRIPCIILIPPGPGCSSKLGAYSWNLAHAASPDANGTSPHPESWNTNANIFFVDQPIGVGFSYADYGEAVGTTEEAAKDMAAFVFIFFENFSQFKGRPFHMAGESYGGRYVPVFAAEVYDQNAKLVDAGYTPINLASVMIGNGFTDFFHQMSSSFDMMCTPASVPPILDIASCVRMKQIIPRCKKFMKTACLDEFDHINCKAAMTFCETHIEHSGPRVCSFQLQLQPPPPPDLVADMNPYDISQVCEGGLGENLCYPVTSYIRAYLDRPEVRSMLGVDPTLTSNFSSCSYKVGYAFNRNLDEYHSTQHYVAALLERDVRVLIYAGTYDWVCNWVGNERWTLAMEWSGQEEFSKQELKPWGDSKGRKRFGQTRSAKGLTFATVDAAGHLVPYDKPKESLELVQRWLAGKAL
ncbi:serine carboxypeptidase [Mycena rebaudengoi]|nr:serine carboxypeptidase [Mycena rebaudengoi]